MKFRTVARISRVLEHFLDEDKVKCDSRSIRSQRIADIYIYIYIFKFLFFLTVVLIKTSNKR